MEREVTKYEVWIDHSGALVQYAFVDLPKFGTILDEHGNQFGFVVKIVEKNS